MKKYAWGVLAPAHVTRVRRRGFLRWFVRSGSFFADRGWDRGDTLFSPIFEYSASAMARAISGRTAAPARTLRRLSWFLRGHTARQRLVKPIVAFCLILKEVSAYVCVHAPFPHSSVQFESDVVATREAQGSRSFMWLIVFGKHLRCILCRETII